MSDDDGRMIFGPADAEAIVDRCVGDVERRDHHCYQLDGIELRAPAREVGGIEYPEINHVIEGAFLCGKLGPACAQCGGVSEVLCDFPIGDEGRTCDKPLCLACAPTVAVDKNYCRDHTNGEGMLLFKAPPPPPAAPPPPKKPRLPKAPPPNQRWRAHVPQRNGTLITGWISEIEARLHAKRYGAQIETWDEFVKEHRRRYPLAPRKR